MSDRNCILIVDDMPENLTVLGGLLRPDYRVRVANSGERALRVAATDPVPDLILLDVMMPDMDGHAVIARLKQEPATRDIPVIFVTAMDAAADEERGFDAGAVDYITKPIQPATVLARVRTHLELKAARDLLKYQNAYLEAEVLRRMEQYQIIQDVSIRALARLAEIRDQETGSHLLRTQHYIRTLAERLKGHPRFSGFLTAENIETLVKSAPLHDIGKVGIPDRILHKRGKLDPDEWEIMKSHAELGAEAIRRAERDAEQPIEFLRIARDIAHFHHECWDGSGYPEGRAGDAIPIAARLMTLADVFDALISERVYKETIPMDEVVELIVAGRGTRFDPDVVDAFVAGLDDFVAITRRYADAPPDPAASIAARSERIPA
jgi:putative two-component system response regulator